MGSKGKRRNWAPSNGKGPIGVRTEAIRRSGDFGGNRKPNAHLRYPLSAAGVPRHIQSSLNNKSPNNWPGPRIQGYRAIGDLSVVFKVSIYGQATYASLSSQPGFHRTQTPTDDLFLSSSLGYTTCVFVPVPFPRPNGRRDGDSGGRRSTIGVGCPLPFACIQKHPFVPQFTGGIVTALFPSGIPQSYENRW